MEKLYPLCLPHCAWLFGFPETAYFGLSLDLVFGFVCQGHAAYVIEFVHTLKVDCHVRQRGTLLTQYMYPTKIT